MENLCTDWNCRLLHPGISPETCAEQLLFMNERFGIRRICMMSDFYANAESATAFRLRADHREAELKKLLPKNFRLKIAACVQMYPGVSEDADFCRLEITSHHLVPLQLPLVEYDDWIDLELNHLLYRQKISPLFLSFERSVAFYPKETIEKLLRIQHAAFQFNYKALEDPNICQIIRPLLSKTAVLLGTALNSYEKIAYYELPYYREAARKHLYSYPQQLLFSQSEAFWDFR